MAEPADVTGVVGSDGEGGQPHQRGRTDGEADDKDSGQLADAGGHGPDYDPGEVPLYAQP